MLVQKLVVSEESRYAFGVLNTLQVILLEAQKATCRKLHVPMFLWLKSGTKWLNLFLLGFRSLIGIGALFHGSSWWLEAQWFLCCFEGVWGCFEQLFVTWLFWCFLKKGANLNHREEKTMITSKYESFDGSFYYWLKKGFEAVLTTELVCTLKVSKTRQLGPELCLTSFCH